MQRRTNLQQLCIHTTAAWSWVRDECLQPLDLLHPGRCLQSALAVAAPVTVAPLLPWFGAYKSKAEKCAPLARTCPEFFRSAFSSRPDRGVQSLHRKEFTSPNPLLQQD